MKQQPFTSPEEQKYESQGQKRTGGVVGMKLQTRAVSEIADQIRGVTYGKQDATKTSLPGYVPVLRAGNITDTGLTFDDLVYVPSSKVSPKQRIKKDDIVIAASSGSLDVVGKAARALEDFSGGFGAFCKVLRPRSVVNAAFFSHYFKTPEYRKLISSLAAGANINNLRNGDLDDLQIPLPPLAEQKRIAAILDAADALRTKRREALAQLDALLQSTFLTLFGDPVTNPMGWEVKKSGELFSEKPKIGTTTPANGKGFLVVRVGEIGSTHIKFTKCGRVPLNEADFERFRLVNGDTVIARAIGSKDQLGKASYFSGYSEPLVIDSHVMRLRPDPRICNSRWFYALLSSPLGKAILQQKGGATAVQFNINAKQAADLDIPLPPLPLQQKFAAIVESIERQKTAQRAHLAELDALFAALQHRAFRGEL